MIVTPDKRIVPVPAMNAFRTGNEYQTAVPGGPAGSSLMTFFCVFTPRKPVSTQILFCRSSALTLGWFVYISGTTLRFGATNSTPAALEAGTFAIDASMVDRPIIGMGTYNNGTMTVWVNGVAAGSATLGVGYTPNAVATAIGVRSAGALPAIDCKIAECGMLDGFDAGATFATINSQWMEDLQQGRYLTWPRAAVVNSDWYWSARDAIAGLSGTLTWTDRFSASVANSIGLPQSSQMLARF